LQGWGKSRRAGIWRGVCEVLSISKYQPDDFRLSLYPEANSAIADITPRSASKLQIPHRRHVTLLSVVCKMIATNRRRLSLRTIRQRPRALQQTLTRIANCNNVGFVCNRPWLLKNSLTRKRSKKLCARMPYKRRSPFRETFSIPKISAVFRKGDFFNTHAWFRQSTHLGHNVACV
jgi:hypothetical protein